MSHVGLGLDLSLGGRRSSGGGHLVYDDLNRPDALPKDGNASALGVASNGEAWIGHGSEWGIRNGRAYVGSINDTGWGLHAAVETGMADAIVEIDVFTAASGDDYSSLVFRSVDRYNLYSLHPRVDAGVDQFELIKKEANAETAILSYAAPTANGTRYRLRVELRGDQIVCMADGVHIGTVTSAFNAMATKHGMGVHSVGYGGEFDNFKVEGL